ncbi:MAG: glycosyltransferase [Rikenellaceae bacterium]
MKILHIITQTELGGAIAVVAHLANKQCDEHEVVVVGGEGDGTLWKILDKRVTQEPCSTLLREISPLNDIRTTLFFSVLNRKHHPDIVHLHSSKAGILGRVAFPSSKVVYTVHGFDSIRLAYRKFLPLEQMMQYMCSAIVGVSYYDERNMLSDKIRRNVSYIYNGIYPSNENVEIKLPDLSAYRKRILCIARLAKPKNHELFIDIARKNPDYAFMWIGNKETPKNIPANCFFMGSIPMLRSTIVLLIYVF